MGSIHTPFVAMGTVDVRGEQNVEQVLDLIRQALFTGMGGLVSIVDEVVRQGKGAVDLLAMQVHGVFGIPVDEGRELRSVYYLEIGLPRQTAVAHVRPASGSTRFAGDAMQWAARVPEPA